MILHDGVDPTRHQTVEILDTVLPRLKKQGYKITTVSDLYLASGGFPRFTQLEQLRRSVRDLIHIHIVILEGDVCWISTSLSSGTDSIYIR